MNPVIRFVEAPASSLADLGWAAILLAALIATWWAGGRNALYLREQCQAGWKYLVPAWYAARLVGMLVIVAIDCWLLAGLVHVLLA